MIPSPLHLSTQKPPEGIQLVIVVYTTLVRRELIRMFRIWQQTLLPPVISMGLYFLVFGSIIGSKIGQMQGHSYMLFIIPGLLFMSLSNNCFQNVASSLFGYKFGRYIDEILISPAPRATIVLGFLTGGLIRGSIVAFLVFIVSYIYAGLPITHPFVIISTVLGVGLLFSLMGFANALFANNFDELSSVPNFILTPLTYLGGIFYSIDSLPANIAFLSSLNPFYYLVDLFRFGFLGNSTSNPWITLVCVWIFTLAALFILTRYLSNNPNRLHLK